MTKTMQHAPFTTQGFQSHLFPTEPKGQFYAACGSPSSALWATLDISKSHIKSSLWDSTGYTESLLPAKEYKASRATVWKELRHQGTTQ